MNVLSPPEQGSERRGRWWRIVLLSLLIWIPLAWIAAYALIVATPLEHADAIVVFAGSTAYIERAQFAARLFREKRASQVILTDDNMPGGYVRAEQRNPLFVERAAYELKSAGVPAEKIEVVPGIATGTYEEAILLRRYAIEHNAKSLLFVTSAYHTRRAWWTLRHVFANSGVEIGISAPPTGQQMPHPATWWFSKHGWQVVAGEYLKFVYYRLRYR